MKNNYEGLPPDLVKKLVEIDRAYLKKSRDEYNDKSEKNKAILEAANEKSFELKKETLLLTGTIFGSSIALSAGRTVNSVFFLGEFYLLTTLLTCMLLLHSHIRQKVWDYAFYSKMAIDSFLLTTTSKLEDFEETNLKSMSSRYDVLMKNTQKGFTYLFFRIATTEQWNDFVYMFFTIGISLILASLLM